MAFESCSNLTSITIPNSVTTIGYSAFFGCTCLTSVTSLIIEPFEIADEVFQNYNNDTKSYNFTTATLFVPKGTKEKYEATAAWNKFQNIVEIEVSDQPKGDVNGDQTVDVADIASVIDCMAGSGAVDKAAADVNGDGTVDVADIATIIDIMAGKDGDTEPVIPEEKAYTICPDDNHPHMIDLGLSSGTRWACCNVGADTPEGYGSYYAWGETWTKINYDWITYAHCDGSFSNCHDIGSDISGTIYDTATVNWGTSWRMPTIDQYHELISSCSSTWINKDGINGLNITGANGSTIFMPASGCYRFSKMDGQNSYGIYWSSTKNPERTSAYFLHFDNDDVGWTFPDYSYREGRPVRPVR